MQTLIPIIGDMRHLLSCWPWRLDVPGPILQGPGYCQSRSTTIFPAVDMYFRLLTAFRFHFSSQTEFLGRYSASCWNTQLMMRTVNDGCCASQWCAALWRRAPSCTVRPVINYNYRLIRHRCVYILQSHLGYQRLRYSITPITEFAFLFFFAVMWLKNDSFSSTMTSKPLVFWYFTKHCLIWTQGLFSVVNIWVSNPHCTALFYMECQQKYSCPVVHMGQGLLKLVTVLLCQNTLLI